MQVTKTESVTARIRWYVCFLVFAATTINYIDRQVLGLLAPILQGALHWSEAQYGFIIMGFQIAYAISYGTSGRLVDAIGTKSGYALAVLLWSIASCLHAVVGTIAGFAIVRFLLGLGEGGNFPAAVKSTVDYFPPRQRALAMGWLNSGMNVAVQLTPLFIPWVVIRWGWHAAFLATGSLGFVWLAAWMLFPYERLRPRELRAEPASRRSILELLEKRESWALCVAKFLTDTIWWFYLYWLPKYFVETFGLTVKQLALPLTIVYLMASVGSVSGGALAGLLVRRSGSVTYGRKMAMFLCGVCALPVCFAASVHIYWPCVCIIALASAAHQGFSANLFVAPADLFPQAEVATIAGLAGTAGAIGGVIFSASAGEVLQHMHTYVPLFIFAGTMYLVALLFLHVLAGKPTSSTTMLEA